MDKFCGMGVTHNGERENSSDSARLGIRAQIQHLKSYANTAKLVQDCVDPQVTLIIRSSAACAGHLGIQENLTSNRRVSDAGYGGKILKILSATLAPFVGKDKKESTSLSPYIVQAYTIQATCRALNIRPSAGTEYPVAGMITESEGRESSYNIVDERNGWRRLKTGVGWICPKNSRERKKRQTNTVNIQLVQDFCIEE